MTKIAYLLLGLSMAAHSQEVLETVTLAPLASARSQPLALGRLGRLRVEALQKGELNPSIFIYRVAQGLAAKNDEDADADAFEWTAPETAQVEVVFYGRSDHTVSYQIKRLPPESKRGVQTSQPKAEVVPVYFATNRGVESRSPFRVSADTSPGNELTFGKLAVRIPLDHHRGRLEQPSILLLEFTYDPRKHFVATEPVVVEGVEFFRDIGQLAARSDRHDALLFIHGYNTTFDDSALRVAQLAYDLKFQGPTVLFSWPSQGQLLDYMKDQVNADRSAEPLSQLLRALAEQAHVTRIHIIAHSMGNRVVAQSLHRVDPIRSNIHQIALMAPDIDADVFADLAREFPKNIGPIAIYASAKDKALQASAHLAGYMRLGQPGSAMRAFPGMESIDASSVDTSILGIGHDYYASSREILEDLHGFFHDIPAADRVALKRSADRRYWMVIP